MEYKILREEAFVSVFNLHADFEYKEKKYSVSATYLNGDSIEDIEVYDEDGSRIKNNSLEEKLYEIGKEILEDMDIDIHFTH